MEKVMLITNTPSPHRIALFNELKKQLFDEGFELRVVFGAFSYDRRKWKVDLSLCEFDYKVLNSRTIAWRGRDEHTLFTYKGLFREMISVRPEVIIVSGFSMATMQVCLFAYLFKVQYFIWTGSVIQRGRMTSLWRMWQRKLLVQRASGGIAYGTEARDYLHSVGIKKENVHIAINTIDTRYFRDQTAKYRVGQKGSSKKILTYVGYLTPRKNVSKVLELVAHLARQRSDFILEVIGDGNDLDELKSYVERNAISSHVRFYGHQNNDLLPKYLAKSDCFLFQTDFDIWGLVLNEAMAAGNTLPCFGSCGSNKRPCFRG